MTAIASPRPAVATLRIAAALAIFLAALDLAGAVIWANAPAPLAVGLVTVALSAVTLVGATAAWYGSRAGALTAAITRIVSVLMTVLALIVPEAPKDPFTLTWSFAQIAVTIVCVVLLFRGRR